MATAGSKFINMGLRGATLGTRFLFLFVLAKHLDPASVGYYGIFTATVGYGLFFVGLDFYTYVTREVLKVPTEQRGRLLKGQLALAGVLYITLSPLIVIVLAFVSWPEHLVLWFVPILFLEHFNQEISRLLIALSEQLASSVILFVRQGSWAIAVVVMMSLDEDARNLDAVMALWAGAGCIAAIVGVLKIRSLRLGGWRLPLDWSWVRKGVLVSTTFLVATLALRGVQTFDRYWLEALGGIEMVGAYVLLLGVASTSMVFLDAAVFSFAYPDLIRHSSKGEHHQAHKKVLSLGVQTLVLSLALSLISWLLLPKFLDWIANPVYIEAASWYPWLILWVTLNSLSMVPHYALYARGIDRPIVLSHIVALLIFLLATWLTSYFFQHQAVFIGLNSAFASILVWKTAVYLSMRRKDRQHPSYALAAKKSHKGYS